MTLPKAIPLLEAIHELRVLRDSDLRTAITEMNDLLATGQLQAVGLIDGARTEINALWWWGGSNFEYPNSSVMFSLLADGEPRPMRAKHITLNFDAWERQKARIAGTKRQSGAPFPNRNDPDWDNPVKLIDAIGLWSPTLARCLYRVKWAAPDEIRDMARRLEKYDHPDRVRARRARAKLQCDGELDPGKLREPRAGHGLATNQDIPEPLRDDWARLLREWEHWDAAERLVHAVELGARVIIERTKRGQPFTLKYAPPKTERSLSAGYERIGDARHDGLGPYDFDLRNSLIRDPEGNWLRARISSDIRFPETASSTTRLASALGTNGRGSKSATNVVLINAVTGALRTVGTPGHNVQWKPFCDYVRKECKVTAQTRGHGDRSIKRLVKQIQAHRDKQEICDMS